MINLLENVDNGRHIFSIKGTQFCVPVIPTERCYTTSTHYQYTGKWSYTVTGILCQRWDSETPHGGGYTDPSLYPDDTVFDAANYCRDPDKTGFLWCYTTDPDIRWQGCGIPKCI